MAISPPHILIIWWTSANWRLKSIGEFGAPQQISTDFASWFDRYCRDVVQRKSTKLCTTFAISWAGTLYIHFENSWPLLEFCHVQNSLFVQVLRSPILAALMRGTPAAGVSQTLRHGTRNGTSQRRHLYSAGRPSRWASAQIFSIFCFFKI